MALFTLAEVKTYLNISDTSEDYYLQTLVDMVDAYVKKYTMRNLEETTYTKELYDGPGTNSLVLRNYPIISVTEVLEMTDEVEVATVSERFNDADDGYFVLNDREGILYRDIPWTRRRGSIEVTYSAGYSTIPDDLKWACFAIVEYLRNIKDKAGIVSESLGSYGYSLATGFNEYGILTIPRGPAKDVLDQYKRLDTGLAY